MPSPIPLSLYIHLPWCVKKCPYCDFNSHPLPALFPEAAYIEALIADLTEETQHFDTKRELTSIFFGGGTPSLFKPASFALLLDTITNLFALATACEISLEANPGTFERGRFKDYQTAGINRISLGVQSFNNQHLKLLGRIHDSNHAQQALNELQTLGLNYNIDLMHGLPQQTPADALADLNLALSFNPPHLSWYQLTLEPNTLFYAKPPTLPDEQCLAEIETQGLALLADSPLAQYEISAFAKPGFEAAHNLNYWHFGDYLAVGAGAHGKLTSNNGIKRNFKYPHPKDYLNKALPFTKSEHTIATGDLPREFMLNALRLKAGFAPALYSTRTLMSLDTIASPLQKAHTKGLLLYEPKLIQPTPLGFRFLNDLIALF